MHRNCGIWKDDKGSGDFDPWAKVGVSFLLFAFFPCVMWEVVDLPGVALRYFL